MEDQRYFGIVTQEFKQPSPTNVDLTMARKQIFFCSELYFSNIHLGIAKYAQEHNWHLNAKPARRGELFFDGPADGVITGLAEHETVIPFIESLKCPVVHIGAPSNHDIPALCISEDHETIARLAFEHFESIFFRNYACYSTVPGWLHPRIAHFQDFVIKAGKSCVLLQMPQKMDVKARQLWLGKELQKLPKPTAIFTVVDDEANEIVELCVDNGIKVPEGIAVIGVHNDRLICETAPIPISSVDIAHEKVGYEAARLLDQLMKGKEIGTDHVLLYPEKVVARQSTNILAVSHPEVAKALEYIDQNYMHNISVDDIVKVTKLTKVGLYKAFKTHLRRTPGKQLTHVRLQKAMERLFNPDAKVYEVADATGFADYHALYLAMKKEVGITPKQYQKQHAKRVAS